MASRISALRLSTYLSTGVLRLTEVHAQALITGAAVERLTKLSLNVHVSPPTIMHHSKIGLNVHVSPPTNQILSQLSVDAWVSLDQAFHAIEPFGSNEVFAPDFSVEPIFESPEAPEIEVNPYRAVEPNVDLQQILREQHNVTQAGDSTFHWGVLTEIYAEPLYHLGSHGRFYHDTLGIIQARYCRFVDFELTDAKAVPVGLRKPSNAPWTVTNRFDLSAADAVLGIALPYDSKIYSGTWYGWVITEGFVPAEVNVALTPKPYPFGTEYAWSATGVVEQELDSNSIGYRVRIGGTPWLTSGAFYVKTDSSSVGRANGLITARLAPLVSDIEGLDTRVGTLETTVGGITTEITAINKRHTDFVTLMTSEVRNLSDALAAVRALMPDGNFQEYVNTAIAGVMEYVNANVTVIGGVANAALIRANEAYALAQSISYAAVQSQLDAINLAMGGITDRIIGFKTTIDTNTLTEGQVLVSYLYNTDVDGVNYYDFRPVDFTLSSLLDVDLVSTPPAHGDSLTWDSVNSVWVPTAVSGGGGGISEAPIDGTPYARQDADWVSVSGGAPWYFNPPAAADFTTDTGGAHGIASLVDDSDVGLLFDFGTPFAGDDSIWAYQAIPVPASDWTVTMRFNTVIANVNYSATGLMCQYSGNSRILTNYLAAGGPALKSLRLNPSSYGSETALGIITPVNWLRMAKVGTDMVMSISADGKMWTPWTTSTIASWLTTDPDRVGFGVLYNRGTGPNVVGSIDYWNFEQ